MNGQTDGQMDGGTDGRADQRMTEKMAGATTDQTKQKSSSHNKTIVDLLPERNHTYVHS